MNDGTFLNTLVNKTLRPKRNETRTLRSDLNKIYNIGKNNSTINSHLSGIFKGGSFGRSTMLRGNYEADYVFMLKDEITNTQFSQVRNELQEKLMENFPNYTVQKKRVAINLQIHTKGEDRDIDVSVATRPISPEQIARKTKQGMDCYYAGNGIFHEKVLNRINENYGYIRDRIQLTKAWFNLKDQLKQKIEKPISFGIESLVLYHTENVSRKRRIDKWFREFLTWFGSDTLVNQQIKLMKSSYSSKPAPCGVNIVDPGNPYKNVVYKWENRDKIQSLARNDATGDMNLIFKNLK